MALTFNSVDPRTGAAGPACRWLRPVAFQNAPAPVLPAELRDDNPLGVWRRVDGELTRGSL